MTFFRPIFMIDPAAIKSNSERAIRQLGGRINPDLPEIEPGPGRTANEILDRTLIVHALLHIAHGAPVEKVADWIARQKLVTALVPSERALLVKEDEEVGEQERVDLSWSVEALLAFLWAGGFTEDLSLGSAMTEKLAEEPPDIAMNQGIAGFARLFRLRPYEELFAQLDFYYRAQWYAVDCGIRGKNPGPFDEEVILERRKALEWMLDPECEWDSPELGT